MAGSKQKRRVLVLGAGGKVGQMLARVWQQFPPKNWEPVYQTGSEALKTAIRWHPGEPVGSLPRVDAIFALWGVTNRHATNLDDNTRLAITALELAGQVGAQRVLLCSSSAVYPRSDQKHAESDIALTAPNPYGQSKLKMEQAVAHWSAHNPDGPQACALRMANVVGAESLFAALARPVPIPLDRFPDGSGPQRSYITVGDLARIIPTLLDCPASALPDLLNVAGDRAMAMADLARSAGAVIEWKEAPEKAVQRVDLDTTRLSKITGPSHSSHDADLAIADWRRWRVQD